MARYTGPSWKIGRRLNFSILETGKELSKRAYAPGQHGQGRRSKLSDYGTQLQEKQKVRHMYGLNEKQFHNTYVKSMKMKGNKGHNFLFLLESRLDNLVYRMGLARTRRQSRQLVNHGHILVDGKKVDIPSYIVKPGQKISVREKSRKLTIIQAAVSETLNLSGFVSYDNEKMEGEYLRLPERNELNQEVNEALIVEFYNRMG